MRILAIFLFLLLAVPAHAVVDPVGWWKLDAGSGSTAIDSGSGANNGTIVNSPSWVTGHIGAFALSLSAASAQYVSIGNPSAVQITGSMTMSVWINPTSIPSTDGQANAAYVLSKGYSSANDTEGYLFRFEQVAGVQLLRCGTYTTGVDHIVDYTFSTDITTGTWYNIICRFDGSTWKIYLNGIEKASLTDSTGPQANTIGFNIGGADNGTAIVRFFNGVVDDVRLYNRALTTTEITNLASQTEGAVAPTFISVIVVE